MRVRQIFGGWLLVAAVSPLLAGEQMTMKVFPAVAFAPAEIQVQASIEVHHDNRALQVIADSPDFYSSSQVALDGERAPRTTVFQLRNLPGGQYVVTTRLLGPSGQTRSVIHQTVRVISPNDRR